MDYIVGVPVTRLRRAKLSTRQRLSFFEDLRRGEFAHRNLVVHRDIKPSNISGERRREPKLPTGIAKPPRKTKTRQLIPRHTASDSTIYASPEQAKEIR
jgi:serine/threonine-protein kinase